METDHNRAHRGIPYLTGPSDFGDIQAVASRWTEKPDVMCQPRDVLVTVKGAGVASLNFAPDEPSCIGRQLMAVRARDGISDSDYVFMVLKAMADELRSKAMGATVPGLSIEHLAKLAVPVPPLPEQKRIAARLREQLAEVEKARHALQSQLDAAEKLPAALLGQRFGGDAAQRWPRRKLGDVLRLRKDIVHPRNLPKGTTIFVGLEHVESLTGRRIGGLSIDMAALTGRKPRFYPGDVVYGYLRPYLNKVWLADREGLCSVDQYVYAVNESLADPSFVSWFMRSPIYRDRAPVSVMQSQLPRIRTEEVSAVQINLPSLEEQRQFAARVETEINEAIATTSTLRARLEAVEKLPAALLREVFGQNQAAP